MAPDDVKEVNRVVVRELVKWALLAALGFVVLGVMSIANRDVYSKEQVDSRDAQIRSEVQHVLELQRQQNTNVRDQLQLIRSDISEVKVLVREGSK